MDGLSEEQKQKINSLGDEAKFHARQAGHKINEAKDIKDQAHTQAPQANENNSNSSSTRGHHNDLGGDAGLDAADASNKGSEINHKTKGAQVQEGKPGQSSAQMDQQAQKGFEAAGQKYAVKDTDNSLKSPDRTPQKEQSKGKSNDGPAR